MVSASTVLASKKASKTQRLLAAAVARTPLVAASMAVALSSQFARADYKFWDGTGTDWTLVTSWSTATNVVDVDPATVPGNTDIAVFGVSTVTANQTVSLNGSQSVSGLRFGIFTPATGNTTTYALQGGSGDQSLTIGSNGILAMNPLGATTIGSATAGQKVNINLDGSQTWSNYSNSLLTVNNNITNASSSTSLTLTINSGGLFGGAGTTINGNISDNGAGKIALTIATTGGISAAPTTVLAGANTYTGATTIKSGHLVLDYSGLNAPATNVISASSNLIMGGGTLFSPYQSFNNISESYSPILNVKGKGAAVNSQSFNNTTLNAAHSSVILTQNSATSVTAGLGAITRNAKATLNLTTSTGGAPGASGTVATTSNGNDGAGILGPWATVGQGANLDYATVSGGNIIALGGSATAAAADFSNVTSSTTNYTTSGASALAAAATGNTLRFTGAGSTIAIGTNTLTLNGFIQSGTSATTISAGAGGGLIVGSSKELVLTTNNQNLTISAPIKDNVLGDGSGVTITSVVPFNTDNRNLGITLSGANTYTGTTNINYGYVAASAGEVAGVSGAFGNGGDITFNGGVLTTNNLADYSARIKNSPSAIAIRPVGNTLFNSALASSNTGGLVISQLSSAPGQLTLNGANAYLGDTILGPQYFTVVLGNKSAFSSGTVYINSLGAISANTDLTGANKLANSFVNQSSASFIKGTNSIEVGGAYTAAGAGQATLSQYNDIDGGALTLSGNVYLSSTIATMNTAFFLGRGTTNITGVIADNAIGAAVPSSVTFGSTGTTNLTAANTYTGGTFIQNGGTVNLDFSATGAPVDNILPPASGLAVLRLRGATLKLIGKDGVSNSQVAPAVSGTSLEQGASKIVLAPGAGGELLYNAFAFGRSPSGTLDITLSGASTATNGVITSTLNANGIIKGITIGRTDWATNSTNLVDGNVVAYTAYTDVTDKALWTDPTQNITNTTAGSFSNALAGPTTINSLRFDNNSSAGLTLDGQTLTVPSGILVSSNVNNKALTISGGNLQGAGATTGDLVVINHGTGGTTLEISAPITDNTAVATPFTKAGKGMVILSGANTYTGITYATEGVLKLNNENALPGGVFGGSGSNLYLRGGVIGLTAASNPFSGDFTRGTGTGVTQVQWTGNGGFAAYGGERGVNLNGGGLVTWNSTSFVPNGAMLILGDSTADAMLNFKNNIALGNTDRVVQVEDGSAAIDARLSGIVSGGNPSAGLVKAGPGTLEMTAANLYRGDTTVLAGKLIMTGSLDLFSGLVVNGPTAIFDLGNNHALQSFDNNSNPIVVANGGSITGSGTSSIFTNKGFDLRSGSVSAILDSGFGSIVKTTSGTVTVSGLNTFGKRFGSVGMALNGGVLSVNTLDNAVSTGLTTTAASDTATVADATGLVVGQYLFGNGNLPLETRITAIAGTTITLSAVATLGDGATPVTTQFESPNALGLFSAFDSGNQANLTINGGTLKYTGSGESTRRLFTLGTSGGTIDSSGTGPMNFNHTGAVAFTGTGARTLGLAGSNTGANTLAAVIGDGAGGATSVVKSGAGNWILTGTNTYTGGNTVNGGTLESKNFKNTLTVAAGAVAKVTVNGGDPGTSSLTSLSLAGGVTPTGTLDLNDNDLIVGSATPTATVIAQIKNARNGGAWNQPGITSSAADANAGNNTTLGVLTGLEYTGVGGTGTFSGQTYVDTDTLVKYTWYGDTDFNGVVGFDDYTRIDQGFNLGRTGWLNGDFDFSGVVGFDDYSLIDLAFNTQSGTLARAISYLSGADTSSSGMDAPSLQMIEEHLNEFGPGYAQAFLAQTPEPAGLGVMGLIASASLIRRRRRH